MHLLFNDMHIAGIELLPKTIHNTMEELDMAGFDHFHVADELLGDLSEYKSVECWSVGDILNWLIAESKELNICYTKLCGEKFVLLNGAELLQMKLKDFIEITPDYGRHLYNSIQRISKSVLPPYTDPPPYDEKMVFFDLDETGPPSEESNSTTKNNAMTLNLPETAGLSAEQNTASSPNREPERKTQESSTSNEAGFVMKRARGRPKNPNKKGKKKSEKLGRLWEFLRELLKDPNHCPSKIKWENHEEGMFRFVKSDQIAKIWGKRKDNLQMSYEKLSRAMRYYYKSKVLLPVYGRRLVYKFGPNAKDWKVDDPNFERARSLTQSQ